MAGLQLDAGATPTARPPPGPLGPGLLVPEALMAEPLVTEPPRVGPVFFVLYTLAYTSTCLLFLAPILPVRSVR